MGFNRFRLFVLIRVIILFLTVAAFVYLIFFDQKYVTTVVTGFLIVFEVFELFNYIESTNKKLRRFFDAIKYNDFNMSFTHDNKLGKTFKELNIAFKEVIDAILLERQKREEFFQELQVVVENIASGIISIDNEGQIKLINQSALNLLGITKHRHSNRLNIKTKEIASLINQLDGSNRATYKTGDGRELAVFESRYKLGKGSYRLFAIQDIKAELQARELEAWQNLTKVLRHEIMNSIAPISSLTSTLTQIIGEDIKKEPDHNILSHESLEDIEEGLRTISGRSDGLINFINAYRDYTNLPDPNKEDTSINQVVQNTVNLLKSDFADGQLIVKMPKTSQRLQLDEQLIEQVLINLIKNAREAIGNADNGWVKVEIKVFNQSTSVVIQDNGPGIVKEAQQKIFMPFYSTKNRGSGIGLSLSKQIMQLHDGDILLESELGKGANFTLIFG
ncbi:PAS domain-containing sensor histidine kinase [Roseivirga sp. E12]|uniref:sensor histidine kinase n=1 Tax=Roseivirga sp. E12 TaxID=2819237 RepID=UPI001ABD242C|nr:ATP-binding protein [Roseivirga sp. E12]MBO3697464.1 histidine kinase [Roseivirga sp. E12]